MNDLISRQAAIEAVMNHYRVGNKPQNEEMDWCAKMLSGLPSAEKGKWMKEWRDTFNGYTHISGYKCTECDALYPWRTNYCPNCGADMRGEGEQDG